MKTASGISPNSAGPSHSRGAATSSTSAATMLARPTCASASRSSRGSPVVGTRQEREGAVIRRHESESDWRMSAYVQYYPFRPVSCWGVNHDGSPEQPVQMAANGPRCRGTNRRRLAVAIADGHRDVTCADARRGGVWGPGEQ